jgi:hypothetical protein
MNWESWTYTLIAGAIGGASSAGLSLLTMPDVFSFSGSGLQHFYKALFIGAIIPVLTFLKQSPLPDGNYVSSITQTSTTIRKATPAPNGEEPHVPTGE